MFSMSAIRPGPVGCQSTRSRVLALDADFARYGLVGPDLDGLRDRYALWRAELLATTGPTR